MPSLDSPFLGAVAANRTGPGATPMHEKYLKQEPGSPQNRRGGLGPPSVAAWTAQLERTERPDQEPAILAIEITSKAGAVDASAHREVVAHSFDGRRWVVPISALRSVTRTHVASSPGTGAGPWLDTRRPLPWCSAERLSRRWGRAGLPIRRRYFSARGMPPHPNGQAARWDDRGVRSPIVKRRATSLLVQLEPLPERGENLKARTGRRRRLIQRLPPKLDRPRLRRPATAPLTPAPTVNTHYPWAAPSLNHKYRPQ